MCHFHLVYADIYLLEKDQERCGEIEETLEVPQEEGEDDDDEEEKPKKKRVASFYALSDGLAVCQVAFGNDAVDSSGLNDFALKVSCYLRSRYVIRASPHFQTAA